MEKKDYYFWFRYFCLFLFILFFFVFFVASIVVFALSGTDLDMGKSWNHTRIVNRVNTPLPFDPHKCPKNEYFYSHPFLVYLEIQSPSNAQLTLSLYNTSIPLEDNKIGSCQAPVKSSCSLYIPNLDNISAFVLAQGRDGAVYTVDWGCYYLNLPLLVSITILFITILCIIAGCCFLVGIPVRKYFRRTQDSKNTRYSFLNSVKSE